MPNDISVKLNVDTKEGVANVQLLGDKTDQNIARIARAVEANNKQLAMQNRLLKEAAAAQKAAGDAASGIEKTSAAGKAAAAAIDEVGKKTHEMSLANAGFVREMAVLFHEGVTGNFQRMLGSVVVLGERSGQLTSIVGALVGPMGAAAAAVGAFAVAAEQGYKSSEDFRKAMILTGGAAGVTEGQFRAMAQVIAAETSRSVGTAKEALQQLVASGQVAPQNLAKMGTAVVQVAHLTGESADKVAEQFQDMASDVAGWIQRHKQYADSMTASQVEAIRQMQRAGDVQGAVGAALDAINAKTADSAGFWSRLGTSIADTWEKASHAIGGNTTAEDKLATLDARIASLQARMAQINTHPELRGVGDADNGATLALYQQQRAQQAAQAAAAQQTAAQRGIEQATQNAAKAARTHLDAMLEEAKGAGALREALKHLQDEFDAAAKGGTPLSDEQQRELRAKVIRQHQDPSDRKEETAYQTTLKGLTDEKAKLDALTESYTRYGRAVDDSREAVLRARIAPATGSAPAGDLAGLSASQKARLATAAAGADRAANEEKDAERLAAVQREVKAYQDLTDAKAQDSREAFIAQALESKGLTLAQQTTDALKKQATILAQAASQRFDEKQQQQFIEDQKRRQIAADQEVDAINRQTEALHQTTLQRQIAADTAKLQKAAEEALAKPYANEAAIQQQLAQNIAAVTAARKAQYEDSRSASTGASSGATKWAEDESNRATFASNMTVQGLNNVSDAIDKLVRTGKFSFKDLWRTMADEFIKQVIRMEIADLVLKIIKGDGGGGSGDSGGEWGALQAGIQLAGSRADGGNINAGGTYLVGERGPELFRSSAAGSITPNSELSSSGGDTHIHIGEGQVINVGQGVSRAEMQQALAVSNAQTVRHVQRLSSQGKLRQ